MILHLIDTLESVDQGAGRWGWSSQSGGRGSRRSARGAGSGLTASNARGVQTTTWAGNALEDHKTILH